MKPQPAFLGPIYRSRSFWSWHVIFRFLLYTSWAHPQKFPSSCHNTCKSEVFMTLNTRGENCGLLCDSVIARQKKKTKRKLSACPGCFSLYTHMLWKAPRALKEKWEEFYGFSLLMQQNKVLLVSYQLNKHKITAHLHCTDGLIGPLTKTKNDSQQSNVFAYFLKIAAIFYKAG